MTNKILFNINFKDLLHYPKNFPVQNTYSYNLSCDGFCLRCEKQGLLKETVLHLTMMSHGCDLSDFESILGSLTKIVIFKKVMFILDNPGGDYNLGFQVTYQGITKKPPVRHYYWTPSCNKWPTNEEDFDGNPYGTYFAYIMNRFRFSDVYITNILKCKLEGTPKTAFAFNRMQIYENCIKSFLNLEIQAFQPDILFAFGRKVYNMLKSRYNNVHILLHPAYMKNRWRIHYSNYWAAVEHNNRLIKEAIN